MTLLADGTAAAPVARSATPDPASADFGLADYIGEGALLLGAGSTVMNQLALYGVGKGVAEHSNTLDRPLDRLRTTLTYVYVMTLGTEAERTAVARMVNKAHRVVRGPDYTAFDPHLQLWVAATLAQNGEFIYEKTFGPMSEATRERSYRECWAFGRLCRCRSRPGLRPVPISPSTGSGCSASSAPIQWCRRTRPSC